MGSLKLDDFVTISGADPHPNSLSLNLIVTNVTKGETYAFRYRAINSVGPGPWSDIGKIQASRKPFAPSAPVFVSSTTDSITLLLQRDADNGGNSLSGYYLLLRDDGDLNTDIDIPCLDAAGEVYKNTAEFTVGKDLDKGKKYRFAFAA